MLIQLQQVGYYTPDREPLFQDVSFTLQKGEKVAIVGNNGAGKTTLLRIIAGQETNYSGTRLLAGSLYYIPQHYGHFNGLTVAAALGIAPLLEALQAVENGAVDQHYYDLLEDNWDITARCEEAFAKWGIPGLLLQQPLQELSGGMKTRLFLSGIDIFKPELVLMDEPTNHLDRQARMQLLDWIEQTSCAVLLTSHDKELLRHCVPLWELHGNGVRAYGGNYDLYAAQKKEAANAAAQQLAHHAKELKEARIKQQQMLERKQQADARAKEKSRNSSDPKILLNTAKNNAESSGGKLKQVHSAKVGELRSQVQELTAARQIQRMMKGHFGQPSLPAGKVLIQATGINYTYNSDNWLWPESLTHTVRNGDRLAITGNNGNGKSTLLQLLLGRLSPGKGMVQAAAHTALLLDQDYTLIDRSKTVLEQALAFNETKQEEAMVHTLLANFLFLPASWHKPCAVLSGGEMLRLALCCMVLQHKTPDLIYLDEPTNNLDLENINMLGNIFADYHGTLVIISHDTVFLEEVGIITKLAL